LAYAAYDRACLARFAATFHPEGRQHTAFNGIIAGMARLADAGHQVWLVSGNTPSVLTFKARVLGVDPRIPRLGSLPGLDRAGLIRKALQGCPGPHLYVGDRPHDQLAAQLAGVPFLGVGSLVPGDHPILDPGAEAEHLLQAVAAILK
jgi:phosphoglycolate phosphatase-like HAD superfamily hydrolase